MHAYRNLPPPLERYCRQWGQMLCPADSPQKQIASLTPGFEALLAETRLWSALLDEIARGAPRFEQRRCGLFANEIALYLEPRRRFSLRLYLYGAEERSPIHDHSAWGIIGSPLSPLEVTCYRRGEPKGEGDYARLEQRDPVTLPPGGAAATLPLAQGIHATGSPGPRPTAMVALYGKPLRRLYITDL